VRRPRNWANFTNEDVWETAKTLRVELRSADVDEFWPPPLIPRSARIPAAARLRDGARPGLQDRRSSSQHLIARVRAARAQALPVVRQMKAGAMMSGGERQSVQLVQQLRF